MKKNVSRALVFFGVLVFFALTLLWGDSFSSIQSLWSRQFDFEIQNRIIWSLRFPRLLLVVGVGGSLALLGGVYQTLFNNSLADPYVLGVTSAVTLGVVLGETCFGFSSHSPQGFFSGFVGSFCATGLIIFSYFWKTGKNLERIILFGLGLNFICSSLVFALISYQYQSVGVGSLKWLFGNIPWLDLQQATLLLCFLIPFCIALIVMGRHLDALSLGDSVARTLGFSPARSRVLILVLSSLLLTLIGALTGAIGFLGLVVPHCIRLLCHPRSSRELLSQSFVGGAIFLALADVISRSVLPPMEFPIGVVSTLLGGPIFLFLLWKK